MFAFFQKLSLFKKIVLISGLVVVVIILIAIFRPKSTVDTSIEVKRGLITETVSVTGQLEPVQSVDLSFQSGGRITQVPVKIGDKVVIGQVLAAVDNSENNAQLKNAQANVAAQKARLDGLIAGARPEDIAVTQTQLNKAQQDLNNYLTSSYDVLNAAYAKANDAVRIQLLPFFLSTGTDSSPKYELTVTCSCYENAAKAKQLRADAEVALDRWKQELFGSMLEDSADAWQKSLDNAVGYLQTARDLLGVTSDILNSSSIALDANTLESYKAAVSAGVTENNTALTAVNSQLQTISAQKIVVQQYADQLALKKAGSSPQDIAAQKAVVDSAQAQADQILAQINKNVIRSPIAGTVTRNDAKVGQSAPIGTPLISVISISQLEIDANVPEVDIGRLAVGDRVDFTVDALPNENFTASVSYIDPAETVIDGVVDFKIKATLSVPDERLKSGLTANLDIRTQSKSDVLILPQFAIIQNDSGTFVQKLEGKTSVQVPVTLGLRSADGMVEITSGVNEGDRVENIGLKK